MQRFATWLFAGWARPALALATLAIVAEVVWHAASKGAAACLGMIGLGLFAFLKALDRIERTTDAEREARRAVTRARRARKTAFWRGVLEAKRSSDASTQKEDS